MTVYADCGATKSRWIARTGERWYTVTAPAINGATMTVEQISKAVKEASDLLPDIENGSFEIYAAGAIGAGKTRILDAIRSTFGENVSVEVDSDMVLAAKATLGQKSGIACILGTGSNTCVWNGDGITHKVPSLGYILGDEGSGASLGRRFISDYLKGQFQPTLNEHIRNEFPQLTVEYVIEQVYRTPGPNSYLAGFVPFIARNIDAYTELSILVDDELMRLFTRNILMYKPEPASLVGFAGGVAATFSDRIRTLCHDKGLIVESIVNDPLSALAKME